MSRSPQGENPEPVLVPVDDADAWGEFLSESSSELQRLRTELHNPPRTNPGAPSGPSATEGLWKIPPAPAAAPTGAAPAADRPGPLRPARLALPPARSERPAAAVDSPPWAGGNTTNAAQAADGERAPSASHVGTAQKTTPPHVEPACGSLEGVTLAHVLARRVPVQWSEAVATIEELCSVLVHQAPSAPVPALEHVFITPAGDVHVLPGTRGPRDTATVGRLLHTLLASTSPPLPLRLFVTSSIASTRHRSIEWYAAALAEHSLPNRPELIGALCRRALETQAPATAIGAPGAAPAPPRRHTAPVAPHVPPPARESRLWLPLVAGVCTVAAVSVGGYLAYAQYANASAAMAQHSRPALPAVPILAARKPPVLDVGPIESDPWAPGTIAPVEAAPRFPRSAGGERTNPTPSIPVDARTGLLPAAPAPGLSLPGEGSSPLASGTVPAARAPRPVAARPSRSAGSTSAAALPPPPAVGQPSDRIYTSADAGVEPPVLASGQPRALPPALPTTAARTVVELVIDERGVVQSASVVGRPQRWDEMMMLSGLKNQRYHPALKDGVPVVYRLRVQP